MSTYMHKEESFIVEAHQWNKKGDDPRVVSYGDGGPAKCPACGERFKLHGILEEGQHIICPGDYIVTDGDGDIYPVAGTTFDCFYEKYERPKR